MWKFWKAVKSVCGGIRPNIIDEHTPWKDTLLLAEQSMFGSSIAPYRSGKRKKLMSSHCFMVHIEEKYLIKSVFIMKS